MSERKHTPGRWVVVGQEIHDRQTGHDETGARIGETPNSICQIAPILERTAGGTPVLNTSASEANARLIAAAPDLLDALRRCLPQVEFTHLYQRRAMTAGEATEVWETVAQARAAIARATEG